MRVGWVCCLCWLLCAGAAWGEGGISDFAQQLERAGLAPFTDGAAAGFPVAEMWFFVEGITAGGTHFAYLNTVARYSSSSPFSALRPVYGASVDDLCSIGRPLGKPFSGPLHHWGNTTSVDYSGSGASFAITATPSSPLEVAIEDSSAGLSSRTTAFGPMFTFQYSDVSLEGSPRAAYVQVMGSSEGTLHGEAFTGWGGVEYHRGYQGWGAAPPFADYWYEHWLLRANVTGAGEPTYSMAIVESHDSGFTGGYKGTGSQAELIDTPVVEEFQSEDCSSEEMPSSITIAGLEPFVPNTRISVSTNFWWVARIASGLFGWWELHGQPLEQAMCSGLP